MINEIIKKLEEREDKRLIKSMPLYVSSILLKKYGFKLYKYTYGRKERGIYIYPKDEKQRVFLSLEVFKGNHTNEEMEQTLLNLVKPIV